MCGGGPGQLPPSLVHEHLDSVHQFVGKSMMPKSLSGQRYLRSANTTETTPGHRLWEPSRLWCLEIAIYNPCFTATVWFFTLLRNFPRLVLAQEVCAMFPDVGFWSPNHHGHGAGVGVPETNTRTDGTDLFRENKAG